MKDQNRAEFDYDAGEMFYKKAQQKEGSVYDVRSNEIGALSNFWSALCWGYERAAFSLFACLEVGIGCDEDQEAALVMLGVARKLGDARCKDVNDIVVPSRLQGKVNKVYQCIKQAQSENAHLYSNNKLDKYLEMFADAFQLSNGKTIVNQCNENNRELELLGDDLKNMSVEENPSCWDNCSIM